MQKIIYVLCCLFAANLLFAQAGGIRGKVTDTKGEPLIGAAVSTKGTKILGAVTDIDGNYSLVLPVGTYTIHVSFVGYATKQLTDVKIDKWVTSNFILEENRVLSEVVVTGVGARHPKSETRSAPTKGAKKAAPKSPIVTRSSEPTRSTAPAAAPPTVIYAPPPPPPPAESRAYERVEAEKSAKVKDTRALYDKKAAVAKSLEKVSGVKSTTHGEAIPAEYSTITKSVTTSDGKTHTETAHPLKEDAVYRDVTVYEDASGSVLDGESKKTDATMDASRKTKPTFLETATAAEKAKMDAEAADESLPDEPEQRAGQLTAGEWSDLKNWNFWMRSIDTAFSTYHKNWKYNFDDRYSVNVVGAENQPIADAQVRLLATDGTLVWESRTDNHGNAELWSGLFGAKYNNLVFKVLHNGKIFDFKNAKTFKTSVNTLKINASCSGLTGLDIAFVVDATGSMGDEIAYLKSEVVDVIRRVKMNNQSLEIRTASVFYKDFSDEYVTRIFPFGKSLKQNLAFIRNQNAGGGGDFEEAVPEGLEAGIDSLKWSENALARIMFLILDAPPHLTAENIAKLHRLTQKAAQKGIRIIPITASGIDKNVEYLMKTLGVTTGGTYVFLTDDSGIGGTHIKATTEKHEVEHLNDLMVRLIKDATDTETCRRLAEKAATGGDAILDASFKLSPTPASSMIYVDMKNDIESLRITNVHGQIMEDLYDLKAGTKEIAVSAWASGVYYATVKQGSTVSTKKFSVIR